MLFPEPPNDINGLRRILLDDKISREKRQWSLLTLDQIDNFTTDENLVPKDPRMMIKSSSYIIGQRFNISGWKDILTKEYPMIDTLLEKHTGHLAVAGGALTRSLFRNDNINDVDFFFYNTNENGATKILIDCLTTLVEDFKKRYNDTYKCRVERNEYTTNFVIEQYYNTYTYQFVHRIYPRLDQIIGGFDLAPAMFVYNGKEIYGNRLSLWSLSKKTCIVDLSRNSSSFISRIDKYYKMGFNVVFPDMKEVELKLNDPNIRLPCGLTITSPKGKKKIYSKPSVLILHKKFVKTSDYDNESIGIELLSFKNHKLLLQNKPQYVKVYKEYTFDKLPSKETFMNDLYQLFDNPKLDDDHISINHSIELAIQINKPAYFRKTLGAFYKPEKKSSKFVGGKEDSQTEY